MSVQVKEIQLGDQALFIRVAKDVFDQDIDLPLLKAYLAQAGNLMVVAILDEEIVGQCSGVIFNHADKLTELYIDELGVGSDFRRRGIARLILDEMFTWGRSAGCDTAWIGAEPDNVAARALYDSYPGEPAEDFKMYRFNLNPQSGETVRNSPGALPDILNLTGHS